MLQNVECVNRGAFSCVYKKAALKQEFLGFSRESNDRPMRVEDEGQVPLFHMEFLQRSNTSKREKKRAWHINRTLKKRRHFLNKCPFR